MFNTFFLNDKKRTNLTTHLGKKQQYAHKDKQPTMLVEIAPKQSKDNKKSPPFQWYHMLRRDNSENPFLWKTTTSLLPLHDRFFLTSACAMYSLDVVVARWFSCALHTCMTKRHMLDWYEFHFILVFFSSSRYAERWNMKRMKKRRDWDFFCRFLLSLGIGLCHWLYLIVRFILCKWLVCLFVFATLSVWTKGNSV